MQSEKKAIAPRIIEVQTPASSITLGSAGPVPETFTGPKPAITFYG